MELNEEKKLQNNVNKNEISDKEKHCNCRHKTDPVIKITHKRFKRFLLMGGLGLGLIIGLVFWANAYYSRRVAIEEIYKYDKTTQDNFKKPEESTQN